MQYVINQALSKNADEFFFSKLHCEGYIADLRYIAGSLLLGVLSAILESMRSTVKRKIFAF